MDKSRTTPSLGLRLGERDLMLPETSGQISMHMHKACCYVDSEALLATRKDSLPVPRAPAQISIRAKETGEQASREAGMHKASPYGEPKGGPWAIRS